RALREVLGDHVEQSGSYVDRERLRFDFSHFAPMTPEEIRQVEERVNQAILAAVPVTTLLTGIEEARKEGAMALFGEKYGDVVRVVKMGEYSTELCGGTHVANTAQIGCFKILSEAGIAAGVRRIEALTAANLLAYYRELEQKLTAAAAAAKTLPEELEKKITQFQSEIKALHQENEQLKAKIAGASLGNIMEQLKTVAGLQLLAMEAEGLDMNGLRNMGDQLRDKLDEGVVVLASAEGEKVNLIVTATEGAIAKGAHAGNLIKQLAPLVGGGGGGRPNMAQAGGKNPAGIREMLEKAEGVLSEMLEK
ncbi:MAG: alanine--tRNA ligase, partial [Lachnospiraceae bacterium]|nr:alanine--tRNA ligase [Lachnospiraceae bacterium]